MLLMLYMKLSIEKKSETLRIMGMTFMGPIGIDLVNVSKTFSNINDIYDIIDLCFHVVYATIGGYFIIKSFKLLDKEES